MIGKAVENTGRKKATTVISLAVSVINICLVGFLESGRSAGFRILGILLLVLGIPCATWVTKRFLEAADKRRKLCAAVAGALMTLGYVCGCRLRQDGTALKGIGDVPLFLFEVVCLSILAAACCYVFLGAGVQEKLRAHTDCGRTSEKWTDRSRFLIYMGFLLLCYLPVFLAYYPSVFAYDAEGQLYQVLAHDYSTHHPLIHTLFLEVFFRLGGLLGSYSLGMAVHSVVQMVLMAGIFAYTVLFLYKEGTGLVLRLLLLLFYGLFPANSVLAISTTKDVLFAGLVLCYVLELYRQFSGRRTETGKQLEGSGEKEKRGGGVTLVLIGALLLLFRNNALYAMIAAFPVTFFLMGKSSVATAEESSAREKNTGKFAAEKSSMESARIGKRAHHSGRKAYVLATVCMLFLFAVVAAGLKGVLKAQNGSPREMLSVPLQQIARTRVEHEEELEPELRQELDQYVSSEWVFAAYHPHLADPVKSRAVIHDNPAGFIKVWIRLGLRYPQTYIDAFLDNSVGLWFLEDQSHAEIYGKGKESGFGYLSTDNRTMPVGFEIVEDSKLPGLRDFMEEIVSENRYQDIPVLSVIFAPAFYWWLLVLYLASAVYQRDWRGMIPAVFLVMYYLTLLLSPAVLVRYMYPLMVSVPVLWGLQLGAREEKIAEMEENN